MRIATWNVNGIRARMEFLLHWLAARKPDIVGLQELKVADDKFPHAEIAAAGYRAVIHGQKAWNGVAVLSRRDTTVTLRGLPGQEDFGARLLTATVEDLSFTTSYCPNGKDTAHADYPRKLAWLDALSDHFRETHDPGKPAILCGDFNVCPTALDSWNEEGLSGSIFHTDEERARYKKLLGWGFHDLYREKHPEKRAFSWWDYRGGAFHQGFGLRIDFLLGTGSVLSRNRSVQIDREYRKKQNDLTPSDHAPVIADLD